MISRECDVISIKYVAWPLVLFTLYLLPGLTRACRLETCLNEYSTALEQGGLKGPESTAAYCQILKAYGACVKSASRSCRGDLQYHSTGSIISTLTKRFECSRFRLKPQRQECSYYGKQDYSYCTLYGRPHLLTFSALYRNCEFRESTTLVDNQFFSIAVTRDKSEHDALLSLVNVTIKSGGTACASEKQYIAYADQQLPPFFVDESQTGGLKNSILINSSWEGLTETVDIYMRYIDTVIVIQKLGTYFGISTKTPSEILNFDPGGLELCRNGCEEVDTLDVESARTEQNIWRGAMEKCSDLSKYMSTLGESSSLWSRRDRCLFQVISSAYTAKTTTEPEHDSLPGISNNSNSSSNQEDNEINVMSVGHLISHTPLALLVINLLLCICQ